MQNQEQTGLTTPLDSFETSASKKRDPALTWLIAFGAYSLLVRFLYAFILPLATSAIASNPSDLQSVYRNFNLITSLGNVALSVAIIVYVNNTLCRTIFAISALLAFYATVTALFMHTS